uniref:MARVEL domain-containing protein n=1 Tax=Acrobeloides nanus TaxID=290746 RepID=A0A914CSP1_9BILA
MSEPAKQDTYTVQNPDGTFATTTTTVKTKVDEDVAYGFGPGPVNRNYCFKPEAIIRVLEIIIGLVIVSLITSVYGPGPFKGVLFGQTILMVFDGIAFCFSFIFLVVFFFNLHNTHLFFWPWHVSDFIFSIVATIFFLVLGILEVYYSLGAWSNNCNDKKYNIEKIENDGGFSIIPEGCGIIYEWAFAAFFCFINAILYAISAVFANRERQRENINRARGNY